ncbi:hypothetical protein LDI01_03200 [Lentilactobacillus diolivorans]|uniref:Uncharacterized protein n=1 Tax=Lentilactobacillus diolivorans TaxID=179838 RepID=A0ABQ0X9M9_9LACO|nr:hypothetical protein LDI01_03200 [Lentilactobacillus diolivorans]
MNDLFAIIESNFEMKGQQHYAKATSNKKAIESKSFLDNHPSDSNLIICRICRPS